MKVKNVDGAWKDGSPKVKIDGLWKGAAKESVKVGNVWREVSAQSGDKLHYKGVVRVGQTSLYGLYVYGYDSIFGIGSRNPTVIGGYTISVLCVNNQNTPAYRTLILAVNGNALNYMHKLKRVVVNGIKGIPHPEIPPNYNSLTDVSFLMESQLPLSGQWDIEIFGD